MIWLPKKKPKKHSKVKVYLGLILGLIILTALVYITFNKLKEDSKVAAVVNGEKITYSEIETLYNELPDTYKGVITRSEVLDQKINEKLLLQKASEMQITVTEQEIDDIIATIISQSGMTEKEFETRIKQQGISQSKLREYYRTQMIILKLLNETALKGVKVEEKDIILYYRKSGLEDTGVSMEEARDQIEIVVLAQKREEAFLKYIDELKSESDIQIFYGVETFTITDNEVCEQDGKPIIRMYSTSNCEQCKWIEETFASTASEYEDIIAYHWVLDTGNNKLTVEEEKSIPKSEAELFKELNPSLKVPFFVFGCKYIREGAGYFEQDDLASEQSEFNIIISKLLNSN